MATAAAILVLMVSVNVWAVTVADVLVSMEEVAVVVVIVQRMRRIVHNDE